MTIPRKRFTPKYEQDYTEYQIDGEVTFAKVHEPQQSIFSKEPKLEYSVNLVFESENDPKKKEFQQFLKKNKVGQSIYAETKTDDSGDKTETGRYLFNFKRTAYPDEAGNVNNPLLVADKFGNPLSKSVLIGNGSKCRIRYRFRATERSGMPVNVVVLNSLQIINLVEYTPQPTSRKLEPILDDPEVASELERLETGNPF